MGRLDLDLGLRGCATRPGRLSGTGPRDIETPTHRDRIDAMRRLAGFPFRHPRSTDADPQRRGGAGVSRRSPARA
ncbi:hypothetical protein JHFBIEKO_2451 [Methylobacterium mesophilicum]|uniref:hypothetical protein n=1 Tax=Methylobacterium mesophilicum TaxID=39956 RepID=UPI001EE1D7B1|nr:hypothetical protein [Methylobacterium mesophilicum]GJE22001.1 hypothetical protein JHFBIEKO_2451 [Methylobacterium mesophilicum]